MRLFIGLPLPEAAGRSIAEIRRCLDQGGRGLSWTPPEALHLTLSFIGEVGEEGLAAARKAFASIELPDKAPSFKATGLGFFPERGPPRVFVLLGTDSGSDETSPSRGAEKPRTASDGIVSLRARLCAELAREARIRGLPPLDADWPDADWPGSRPRRPFSPHLTLARLRDRPTAPVFEPGALERAAALAASLPAFALDRMILYESRLERGGARHIPLESRFFRANPPSG